MRPVEEMDSERTRRVHALESRRDYEGVVRELRSVPRPSLLRDPTIAYVLALALRATGDGDAALDLALEIREPAQRSGLERLERRLMNLESALRFERGEVTAARGLWEQVLHLATLADDHELVAKASNNLGVLGTLQGRPEEAIAAYGRAHTACQRLGDRRGLAQAHQNLAINFRETGLHREAHAHFRDAMAHARATDSQDILGRAEEERAVLLLMTGDPVMARATAQRALERFEAVGDAAGRGEALRVLGQVGLATGQLDEARSRLEDALDLARSASAALLEAETLATLAAVHRQAGDTDQADQATQAADAIFHRLGATAWGARLHERLAASAGGD